MRYSDALSEFEEEWEDEAEDADGGWAAELSDEDGQEYDCAPPPPTLFGLFWIWLMVVRWCVQIRTRSRRREGCGVAAAAMMAAPSATTTELERMHSRVSECIH